MRATWFVLNIAATTFVGAFLLFQIQPLIGKYILPWFGGSPAVWTTCMLFFQSLLFAGYAYAHLAVRWLRPAQQGWVHLVLIAAAILLLQVVPGNQWKPTTSDNPAGRILSLLAVTVGFPYFVLASTGPLLQSWFARVFPGRIPYRLYALSNFGSLLALLSYPFFVERIFDARQQAGAWWWGFILYGILCGLAAASVWMMFRRERPVSTAAEDAPADAAAETKPGWNRRVVWLLLPTLGSVTLLAVTNHVSTDVAPMPFLWVVPLSLYLLTFIVAFDHSAWYRPVWVAGASLAAIYLVAMFSYAGIDRPQVYHFGMMGRAYQAIRHMSDPQPPETKGGSTQPPASPRVDLGYKPYLALNFAALFGICMMCHGELVRLRPHPSYLTGYYLMIAAGGAAGGILVTLVAPHVFKSFFEFNLALMIGFLLAAGIVLRSVVTRIGDWPSVRGRSKAADRSIDAVSIRLLGLSVLGFALVDTVGYLAIRDDDSLYRVRNFFGTLSVEERQTDDGGKLFSLKHGQITHGIQYRHPELEHLPTTYYAPQTGVGRAIGFYRQSADQIGGMRLGAVGLGVGTLAAYLDQGDFIRFYEINPDVVDIAESGRWFTYLKNCRGKYDIALGDARLSLEHELQNETPRRYHLLVLDAFSGDAIPAHLLTEEAFETYLPHLASPEQGGAHGAVVVHITNRYVELEPIVAGIAKRFDLDYVLLANQDGPRGMYESDWIVLTQNAGLLRELAPFAEPAPEKRKPPQPFEPVLWTDSFNNLFDALK